MAIGVTEGILRSEHVSGFKMFPSHPSDRHSGLKNLKWRIQYGVQVNLINFINLDRHIGSAILSFLNLNEDLVDMIESF